MWKIITLLFLLAVSIRLLYFPDNVYFAYDLARDSYTSLEILEGDLKIIGPPSFAGNNLFAGPLVFYLYAPIYFLFDKNPEALSIFLRVINALGIFVVYFIAKNIFNKNTAFVASLLYAFSYEQTQYSLFISHQPLAVLPVLIFYLGLVLLIFKNKSSGIFLVAAGAGFAIQFHYIYSYLIATFVLSLSISRKIKSLVGKHLIFASSIFLLTISTYIISEFKFGFRTIFSLVESGKASTGLHFKESLFIFERLVKDNLISDDHIFPAVVIILIAVCGYLVFRRKAVQQMKFLLMWIAISFTPYLFSGTPSYYYLAGTNVALLIFVSFLIANLRKKYFLLSLFLTLAVIYNNISKITTVNPRGVNQYMVIQPEMLTREEKKVLDYIYQEAGNEKFGVKALTVPFNINTTWSYIFEWYGERKYGYLPTWVGPIAEGYSGIKAQNDRSKIPKTQFLIVEPASGIRQGIIDNFFKEENYFTKIIEERSFGSLTVQKRERF